MVISASIYYILMILALERFLTNGLDTLTFFLMLNKRALSKNSVILTITKLLTIKNTNNERKLHQLFPSQTSNKSKTAIP